MFLWPHLPSLGFKGFGSQFIVWQIYTLISLPFKKRHYKHISFSPCYLRYIKVRPSAWSTSIIGKFWQSGVPTPNLLSRQILKVCALSRVEAWFWNPKIMFTRRTNTSPVQKWLNTKVNTQIVICVMPNFLKFTSLFVFS